MKKSDTKILNLLAFLTLCIVAVLVLVGKLLGLKGAPLNFLDTLKEVFVLIIIGISAYNYVLGKSKGWTIAFWVAVVIFVVGIVLIWF